MVVACKILCLSLVSIPVTSAILGGYFTSSSWKSLNPSSSISLPLLGRDLTSYDHFAKPTKFKRPLITGGRLISRHLGIDISLFLYFSISSISLSAFFLIYCGCIKGYLAEAGVKSVVSLFPFNATNEWKGVSGDWLSSDEEVSTCESLGMDAIYFDFGSDTFTVDNVNIVSKKLSEMPKPIYIHCHVG